MAFTLRTISITDEEILKEQTHFENILRNAELIKINMTEAYLKYKSFTDLEGIAPSIDYDDEISCDVVKGNIIKIKMNGLLPFINNEHKIDSKVYFRELRDHYVPRLNRAIQKRNPNIAFLEKAFVLILQYFPNNRVRDLDNQFKSFIFNSLRFSQIIKGDSWQSVSYMDLGKFDENYSRTEIYISSFAEIKKVLEIANIFN